MVYLLGRTQNRKRQDPTVSFKEHLDDFCSPTGSTSYKCLLLITLQLWGNTQLGSSTEKTGTNNQCWVHSGSASFWDDIFKSWMTLIWGWMLEEDRRLQLCPSSLLSWMRYILQVCTHAGLV